MLGPISVYRGIIIDIRAQLWPWGPFKRERAHHRPERTDVRDKGPTPDIRGTMIGSEWQILCLNEYISARITTRVPITDKKWPILDLSMFTTG